MDDVLVGLGDLVPTGVLTMSAGAVRVGAGETCLTVLRAVFLGEIFREADYLVVKMGDEPEGRV